MSEHANPFGARVDFDTSDGPASIYDINVLEKQGVADVSRLPFTIKVLLENLLRHADGHLATEDDVAALACWQPQSQQRPDIPFMPARVVMQDFTGVPAVVDFAAMREAMKRLGGDPSRINPLIPADMVIDHSVQVDAYGSDAALLINAEREFERNRERYEFLHWGQRAFHNFRVVPPASGIVHQVNLEYLATVVQQQTVEGEHLIFPDTLVGTDSHTTMVNALGVLGWGVGGIEAEANMLGQPLYMLTPDVVGFKLTGALPEGATATDLVLTVTQMLRKHGVVNKFVEYFGDGLSRMSVPDRATIANMSPDYGATMGFFPVDGETLRFLRSTGRSETLVTLVERYFKALGVFRTDETPVPMFTETLELDMGTVEPSIAGPKRPQDRVPLREGKSAFHHALSTTFGKKKADNGSVPVAINGSEDSLTHGSLVIAAITSCTNTSNPSVMIGAGLVAKKAVERGLGVPPHVKTSMAPGSRVVKRYLDASGLMPYLEALRFHIVGYGCTTCIGNSGPLPESIVDAVAENDLVIGAVLSGNRNFEGRISPLVKANYLASPPLVVAYAIAGTMDIDLATEPLGLDANGEPVYLADIWPTQEEVSQAVDSSLDPEMFTTEYAHIFDGDEAWNRIESRSSVLYDWGEDSTYIKEPPFFQDFSLDVPALSPIRGARVLALLGDTVTTDHISPAGSIATDGSAGQYLISLGVEPKDFNTFGTRRGNHEVMIRGTFGNVRLRNQLAPGTEGGWTTHLPDGERMNVYDAAVRYQAEGTPLLVIAGKEYGTGSSRDWAAKGVALLGVKAVLAESYERIHRSNLAGMGVLPLEFKPGDNAQSLGLSGREVYDIEGIGDDLAPGQEVTVRVSDGADEKVFQAVARLDTPVEVDYYRNGGILQTVLRQMVGEAGG